MPDPSKTEKATSKKRRDERKKGNVFSSKDVISVASVLVMFTVFRFFFPSIVERLFSFTNRYMDHASTQSVLTSSFIMNVMREVMVTIALAILPIMGIAIATTVVATGFQTKFLFSWEAVKPKFSKLNPINGIKNMFSLKSLIEVIKGIIKIIIIVVVLYQFFMGRISQISSVMTMEIPRAVVWMLTSTLDLVYSVCIAFVFIAAADFLYQRWDYENKIKMTKHEVKEEYKQLEGDPKIKGKIREQQRKIANSRMMQQVPSADVVIKNPTHYAIALRYDIDKDPAPIIVAKGQDEIALKIIEIAELHDVYVLENKELAREIYASSEINENIPIEFYSAVAEILALVYKVKEKKI